MKTITTTQNMLRSIAFAALFTISSSALFAQVKIGTNPTTITSTSNLEVESTNGTKVVVDKASGFLGAGVTDPSQSIDGAGTARLRNIPIGANSFVLSTDPNGVIYKQSSNSFLPVIRGSMNPLGVNIVPDGAWRFVGANLVLPANSTYVISTTMLMAPNNAFLNPDGAIWMRLSPSDSFTSYIGTGDIVGTASLFSGSAELTRVFNLLTGSITLRNSTNAPKVYYLWANAQSNGGTVTNAAQLNSFASSGSSENQIYGIPVN